MKKTTIIILTVALFGSIVALALLVDRGNLILNENRIQIPDEDTIDVSVDFAQAWLDNLQATSSVSLSDFLSGQAGITDELKSQLLTRAASDPERDVILCQSTTPERIGAKVIYTTETQAQVTVLARGGEKTPNQAIVTMDVQDGEWVISDLSCSAGEVGGPVGEYTFEQIGRLARESVPAPYDNATWHLIFSQANGSVQIVTLLFDEQSQCLTTAGQTVCDPGQLEEGVASFVQADMTEAGALVRRLDVQ